MLRFRFCASLALPLLALSLLIPARPAFCQAAGPKPADVAAALSGSVYPLALKLKDLDGSWRVFSFTGGASDTSGQLGAYFALLTGSGQSSYYTRGETVTLGGEVYLVAYRQKNTLNYSALFNGKTSDLPTPPKPTPDTVLSLSLLNLRSVVSLNDIQVFSLQDTLNPPPPPAPPAPDPKDASVSNLKQLGLGLIQYVQDYDEVLPPMKSAAVVKTVLMPYIKSESVFVQPKTNKPYLPNTSLSHRKIASFLNPSTMVTYYEADPQDDGKRAVLFLDGHVTRVEESEWQRLKAASHVPNPPQEVQ